MQECVYKLFLFVIQSQKKGWKKTFKVNDCFENNNRRKKNQITWLYYLKTVINDQTNKLNNLFITVLHDTIPF